MRTSVIALGLLAFGLAHCSGDKGLFVGDERAPADLQHLAIPPEGGVGQAALAAAATRQSSPTPIPGAPLDSCGPPVTREYLASNQVLAYYGNPYTNLVGILGELSPPTWSRASGAMPPPTTR